jgi:hypothetical protein
MVLYSRVGADGILQIDVPIDKKRAQGGRRDN